MASNPVRLPMSRPALPRASSAASGFFFCGMIAGAGGEPVVECEPTPNSIEAHRQISSPSRDRWTPQHRGREEKLGGEVTIADCIDGVAEHRVEAQLLGDRSGSSGK